MNGEERLYKIILAPYLSEKSTMIGAYRQYVFKVLQSATKLDIKKAVEYIFNVKVAAVRVCNVKSKIKTFSRITGRKKGWKKAYVTLQEGQSIEYGSES